MQEVLRRDRHTESRVDDVVGVVTKLSSDDVLALVWWWGQVCGAR